jgi:fluoride ion exporter CrcB/FEX
MAGVCTFADQTLSLSVESQRITSVQLDGVTEVLGCLCKVVLGVIGTRNVAGALRLDLR